MTLRNLGRTIVLIATLVARPGGAQDWLARAQALYAEARYEDALRVLDRAPTNLPLANAVDVMRVRALCWYALGQTLEGERAVAALVELDPLYDPHGDDVPPRVAQAIASWRRARLPVVARGALYETRRALQRSDVVEAERQLEFARQVLEQRVLDGTDSLPDLRLAAGALADLYALASERQRAERPRAGVDHARPTRDRPDAPIVGETPRDADQRSATRRPIFKGVDDQ